MTASATQGGHKNRLTFGKLQAPADGLYVAHFPGIV